MAPPQDPARSSGPRLHRNGRASLALRCPMRPSIDATRAASESRTAFFNRCRTGLEKNPSEQRETAFITALVRDAGAPGARRSVRSGWPFSQSRASAERWDETLAAKRQRRE